LYRHLETTFNNLPATQLNTFAAAHAAAAKDSTIAELQAQITAQAATIAKLTKKLARPPTWDSYCWTHGAGPHSGKHCPAPAAGHQPTARFKDRKGGSTAGVKDC